MSDTFDDAWNGYDSFYSSIPDVQCYDQEYSHYTDRQFDSTPYDDVQQSWSQQTKLCEEYRDIYTQLKPILDFAHSTLPTEVAQQYQNRIDAIDSSIFSLERTLTSEYSQAECYYDPTPTQYYVPYEAQNYVDMSATVEHPTSEQYASTLDTSDQIGQVPEYSYDYNNNNDNNPVYSIDDGGDYCQYVTLDSQMFELTDSSELIFSDKTQVQPSGDEMLIDYCKLDLDQLDDIPLNSTPTTKKREKKLKTKRKGRLAKSSKKQQIENERRIWYRCGWEGCSFGSYYNGVVKRHSFKRHSGEMRIDQSESDAMHRFKCDWPGCDVSLVAYHKLVEHKRRHTGEKPFGCKWKACQYSTGRLYSLIIHERVHKDQGDHLD